MNAKDLRKSELDNRPTHRKARDIRFLTQYVIQTTNQVVLVDFSYAFFSHVVICEKDCIIALKLFQTQRQNAVILSYQPNSKSTHNMKFIKYWKLCLKPLNYTRCFQYT